MIIVWIRNIVLLLSVLTVTYVIVSASKRRKRRAELLDEYDGTDQVQDKSEFVAQGMVKYTKSYRSKLILCIFLLPIFIFFLLIYLANRS
jgi:uncharacterized ion transporter superfamily protein YfcC